MFGTSPALHQRLEPRRPHTIDGWNLARTPSMIGTSPIDGWNLTNFSFLFALYSLWNAPLARQRNRWTDFDRSNELEFLS